MVDADEILFRAATLPEFLKGYVGEMPRAGRGVKRQMAEALGCTSSHISQVFSGSSVFTPEQGLKLGRFLKLDSAAVEYLMTLVAQGRASTVELRQYHDSQLAFLRSQRKRISGHVRKGEERLRPDQIRTYYSDWSMAAVHVLLGDRRERTLTEIADELSLAKDQAGAVCDFLVEVRLLARNQDRYTIRETRLHTGAESEALLLHHRNWRLKAIEAQGQRRETDLFFSSIYSLPKENFEKLRKLLLTAVRQTDQLIADAEEEELICFNVDLFRIRRG